MLKSRRIVSQKAGTGYHRVRARISSPANSVTTKRLRRFPLWVFSWSRSKNGRCMMNAWLRWSLFFGQFEGIFKVYCEWSIVLSMNEFLALRRINCNAVARVLQTGDPGK